MYAWWNGSADSRVTPHVQTPEAGAHRVWDGTILVANESSSKTKKVAFWDIVSSPSARGWFCRFEWGERFPTAADGKLCLDKFMEVSICLFMLYSFCYTQQADGAINAEGTEADDKWKRGIGYVTSMAHFVDSQQSSSPPISDHVTPSMKTCVWGGHKTRDYKKKKMKANRTLSSTITTRRTMLSNNPFKHRHRLVRQGFLFRLSSASVSSAMIAPSACCT